MVWQTEWNIQENHFFPPGSHWTPEEDVGDELVSADLWDSFHLSLEDVKYTLVFLGSICS